MDTNEVLTTPDLNVMSKPYPTNFWMGALLAVLFLGIQLAVMLVLLIIGMFKFGVAKYGAENLESNMDLILADTMPFAMKWGLPLAFIIGALLIYLWRGMATYAFRWKNNFIPLTIFGFLMVLGISSVIGEIMTYMPGYEAFLEQYKAMFEGIDPTVLLIGGAFVGPICEEIIFRGVILEGFLRKYDPMKAILFSALIFGIIHLQPLQVVGAFFSGAVLGWIYYKTRSLWVCIFIHIINNFLAFTFEDVGTESTREFFGNDLLYAGSFLIIPGLVYLAYLAFEKINRPNELA